MKFQNPVNIFNRISLLAALAFVTGIISTVNAQIFLTNGLVAYYPLNGNANDAIGTNNGTVYNAVLTTNRFGQSNSAYLFNGSSSYIDLGRPTNLQFTNNFTVTAWCLFSGGSAQNPRIVSYTWGAGYELLTTGNGTSRTFQALIGEQPAYTSQSYGQGNWNAVAMVYSNGTAYIYVNGILAGSGVIPAPITYTNNLHIGNNSGTTQWDWWGGSISDVRFYNRTLSTNEVQALYQYEATPSQIVSATPALRLNTTNLVVGVSYQIQTSPDLINWTNYGASFTAVSNNEPQYVDQTGSQGFFRILPAQ